MSRKDSPRDRFNTAHKKFQEIFPQVYSVVDNERDFISLMVKTRDDGTCLAVLKEFGPDGSPIVCFGSGYGVIGAFMGLEGTVAAGKWRSDTPPPK